MVLPCRDEFTASGQTVKSLFKFLALLAAQLQLFQKLLEVSAGVGQFGNMLQ